VNQCPSAKSCVFSIAQLLHPALQIQPLLRQPQPRPTPFPRFTTFWWRLTRASGSTSRILWSVLRTYLPRVLYITYLAYSSSLSSVYGHLANHIEPAIPFLWRMPQLGWAFRRFTDAVDGVPQHVITCGQPAARQPQPYGSIYLGYTWAIGLGLHLHSALDSAPTPA